MLIVEGIKQALIISILSKGWSAALALLAVPFYLDFIGVEAYGIVGLFVNFSILIGFLDFGLGTTLTRELARQAVKTETLADRRDIVHTFEFTYALIALLIGVAVAAGSTAVAKYWVRPQTLTSTEIAQALILAGIALACQWPTNLYSAGLAGLQRQVQLGVATMLFSTIRILLTLTAVWWQSNLESFFLAQTFSAGMQTLGTRWLLWRCLTMSEHKPCLKLTIIKSSLRFASGITGITITSIILTQIDKVILSRVLNLTEFGVYVVASTFAAGLYVLISPMFSVIFPRFSTIIHEGDTVKLASLYHASSQVMALLVIPAAVIIALFSKQIAYIWTGDYEISLNISHILPFLIMGNAFNGLLNIPFSIQMAYGWTSLALGLNILYIFFLAPGIWLAALNYGATGAASLWLILNSLSFLFMPLLMHKKLIKKEMYKWYKYGAIIPLLTSFLFAIPCASFNLIGSKVESLVFIMLLWLTIVCLLILILPRTRYYFLTTASSIS